MVKFYPNPATSVINFELQRSADKSATLQLFNFMGKKVYEAVPGTQERMIVSLDGFFRGVYIYQLRDKFGQIIDSGKFQVVK
ncbi:MAG: T9SS type A sorting domain-containing protein [Ferruginibacter sp.]